MSELSNLYENLVVKGLKIATQRTKLEVKQSK